MASNLPELLHELLEKEGGSWDKTSLHPSMDLQGCLRRTCLDYAKAEKRPDTFTDLTRKRIGRELHRWLQWVLEKNDYEVEKEVKVHEGLPDGWRGSADILLRARKAEETWLIDLKTVSSVSLYMADVTSGRVQLSNKSSSWPSEDYVWQLSAYYHALKKMGHEVDRAMLLFWPVDTYYDRQGRKHSMAPRQAEIDPIPEEEVWAKMDEVSKAVDQWKGTWEKTGSPENYDLPSYMEPEQKLIPKPSAKRVEYYEVHQKLDWRCRYCPFFQVSCQPPYSDEKVGEYRYEEGVWVFYPEYAGAEPLIRP